MTHEHMVAAVEEGSIAWELGITPGDKLLAINDKEVQDVFDYYYLVNDETLIVWIQKPDGEEWELEIEKEPDEDLGIRFEQSLMDEYKSCRNQCMFCFIDQMPKGMRETLYFKDDDSRLSFLQGNYITLTNMSEQDIKRIIEYHLEPINISFHTTNPELRCRMLHNRFAGEALRKAELLYQGRIRMNGQIVLCKGINDGGELEKSISDLSNYMPYLQSVSVVPVGLTKYREGLTALEPFGKEDAQQVLSIIHAWQEKLFQERGSYFIHGGDEWYLLAGEELPEESRYDGYRQLENGVGMLRLLMDEFAEALKHVSGDHRQRSVSVATGMLAYPHIKKLAGDLQKKFPAVEIHVYPIKNNFFGEHITVSGLITAQDLIEQLRGCTLGECLLLPCNMLRSGEEIFLDDIAIQEVKDALQVSVGIVKSSGQDLVNWIIG